MNRAVSDFFALKFIRHGLKERIALPAGQGAGHGHDVGELCVCQREHAGPWVCRRAAIK
jgi:hypothetical protein